MGSRSESGYPHDRVAFLVSEGQIRLAPATSVVARTASALRSERPALSPEEEEEDAAETAMAEDAAASNP